MTDNSKLKTCPVGVLFEQNSKLDLLWDMETGDPDDFLTLLLLAGHPRVNLRGVLLTPGTPSQVGLVQHALREWFGLNLPVGAYNLEHPKQTVSEWHYRAYGPVAPSREAEPGPALLRRLVGPNVTLVTGGPLKNIRAAIAEGPDFTLGRLVVQGGFAGEGVVPPELQLPKFKGLITCPSYNLNGDPKGVFAALGCEGIGQRYFVSKNVCHRVVYDRQMHEIIGAVKDRSVSLGYIWQGMDFYLWEHREGKLLHDPLAACCAIDPSIAEWAEVEIYREHGEWGARLAPGSNTWIIVDYDHARFVELLTASAYC